MKNAPSESIFIIRRKLLLQMYAVLQKMTHSKTQTDQNESEIIKQPHKKSYQMSGIKEDESTYGHLICGEINVYVHKPVIVLFNCP